MAAKPALLRRAPSSSLTPAVVARYFPSYRDVYARRGWTMFDSIDRVYDSRKAAKRLGFTCATGFREILDRLAQEPTTLSSRAG